MDFTEENIASLFGHEAAEDEDITRLKSYYLKGATYEQVINDLPIRILVGHKGIGKSALFHVAMSEDATAGRLSLLIKPDDIAGIGDSETNFLKLIREWKKGITEIIARKALISFGINRDDWRGKLNEYGGKFIDFLQTTFKAENHTNLSASQRIVIDEFLKTGKIFVYLDDLDRGWQGDPHNVKKLSALLNAVRDLASECKGVCFRISLRTDVYYLVRTSDESTDKIEGSVIWYAWTNHEILAMLVKRIEHYYNRPHETIQLVAMNQTQLARFLSPVMEDFFNGRGNWRNIPTYRMLMSLVRKRPRDIVKLCTLAARNTRAKNQNIIGTDNFNEVFEEYSQGRLQDTVNEYRTELPDIERLLLGMKPSRQEKRVASGYIYTTEELLPKLKNIQQSGEFRFHNGKKAETKDLAAFLYKINFITARKIDGEFIQRKFFEESRYLSHKFVDFGFDWEVHPAYRWALQPDNINDVFDTLQASSD
ncbi:P-loop ATPase, Sll1717 family [Chromobacterium haemolyticum]|uniref:P-loop ATPase, Sll1717 family n=1 Tax=Chromobacterium haemolyticum TaxID=394935 RepID=UPI0040577546